MKGIAIFFLIAGLLPGVLSAEFGLGLPGVIKKRVERLDQKVLESKPAIQPQQPKSWGSATLIETDDTGNASSPQVALDTSGNGIAVWYQSDGTRTNILANRFVPSTGWGQATLIETGTAGDAYYPQVALDTSGNGIAVWHQDDGTRYNIWANRYTVGTGWRQATLIETDNGGAYYPQVALDTSGNGIAVWHQDDGTRYNIWANRFVQGTGWRQATLIETENTGYAWNPQVALDTSGNGIAVWQQWDGTRDNIWANRYSQSTGTWSTATVIGTNTGNAYFPQVALDTAGNGIAVWCQSDGTRYSIWANRFVQGTGWGIATLIETDNGDAQCPQVALDTSGNGIAVWEQSDVWHNICANRYIQGTGWGSATLIETDNDGNAESPQVALDTAGNAIAVWEQLDVWHNICANRYTNGTGWGQTTLIETDNAGHASNPQVALDTSGNGIAVWEQSDGTRHNIWANLYR